LILRIVQIQLLDLFGSQGSIDLELSQSSEAGFSEIEVLLGFTA